MKTNKQEGINLRLFQRQIEKLYGNVNNNLSIEYIYGYLSRSIGYLCKKLANNSANEVDFIGQYHGCSHWHQKLVVMCNIHLCPDTQIVAPTV